MAGITVTGPLILASASPRRSELLKFLDLEFEILPSHIDESPREGETPEEHVLRLSSAKAFALTYSHPDAWILGADTIVVIRGESLGKPSTPGEARSMLTKLSGQTHKVYTGVALISKKRQVSLSNVVASDVRFKDVPQEEIEWYVRTSEPYDKAGGYALQGRGALFVEEIHGSPTNIIGLPLCETAEMLKAAGVITFSGYRHG